MVHLHSELLGKLFEVESLFAIIFSLYWCRSIKSLNRVLLKMAAAMLSVLLLSTNKRATQAAVEMHARSQFVGHYLSVYCATVSACDRKEKAVSGTRVTYE
jgi:hypothetical protein